MRVITVERHRLGPRLRFLGLRVHHWHVGLLMVAQGCRMVWRDLPDLLDAVLRVR